MLVVGGGPVGLLTATGLHHFGVKCLLIEKHSSTLDFPKGRRVTTRTMEIFRQWGLEAAVTKVSLSRADSLFSFEGDTLLGDDYERRSLPFDEVKRLHRGLPPHVLLVLDATVGQNALQQVEVFERIAGVTGLVMTKLDGTARGGILVAIAEAHGLPIHFIGVGEGAEDLEPFTARDFARAIAGLNEEDAPEAAPES